MPVSPVAKSMIQARVGSERSGVDDQSGAPVGAYTSGGNAAESSAGVALPGCTSVVSSFSFGTRKPVTLPSVSAWQ